MKKKIAIIGTMGVPSSYGGFETLVDNLLDYISKAYEITVFCQSSAYVKQPKRYKNADLVYLPFKANGVLSIIYDILSVLKSFRKADVLLILGVSGSVILPFIKPFFKGKIITNIDGLEWKREKWGYFARKFLKFSENISVRMSDIVIADNLHIQRYVKETYNVEANLIAYGGNHVKRQYPFTLNSNYDIEENNYFFTVCRIEPENNLDIMVQAYQESLSEKNYVIVGNFGSSDYSIQFKTKYKNIKGLKLLDPIYDSIILDQLRSFCFYYLHGHSAGGTNPSLVEAMSLRIPVIAYGVSYNRETTHHKAIYFENKNELVEILKKVNQLDRERIKTDLFEIANKYYTWEVISEKYNKIMK